MKSDNLPHPAVLESYEIRPGIEVLRYVQSWLALKHLAKNANSRKRKFFLDVTRGCCRFVKPLEICTKNPMFQITSRNLDNNNAKTNAD